MRIALGSIVRDGPEVNSLVQDYYARTIASQGMRPLKFKWQSYKALEDVGACKLFTARVDSKLIGFALYVVQDHLHHDDQITAQCTMIGVAPEHRSKGVGTALIENAERRLRQLGATHMVHNFRTIYEVRPLFERLGFKLEELGYVKEL